MPASKPLKISFGLPFEDAIAAAKARKVELPEDFYARIPGEARRAATTVSGLAGLDQIQAVIDSLDEALSGDVTLQEWKKSALARDWGLPRGRVETIFRTNVQTAYSAGHWEAFREHRERRPYLMWSAINDSRVRPTHLAMDGHIAPIDDPIWREWHPPAGYNCRCSQISLTEEQARARGYGRQTKPDVQPDDGFAESNPGSLASSLASVIARRWKQCDTFDFGTKRTRAPAHCGGEGAKALQRWEAVLESGGELAEPRTINATLMPTGLREQTYLAEFMRWFGERWDAEAIVNAGGYRLPVSKALFQESASGKSKLGKRERSAYVAHLANNIIAPDEIWLSEDLAKLFLLSRFQVHGRVVHAVAVFRKSEGAWTAVSTFHTFKVGYFESLRQGILSFSRPKT